MHNPGMAAPKLPPFLLGIQAVPERFPEALDFPFSLPFLPELDLAFHRPVTFFAC